MNTWMYIAGWSLVHFVWQGVLIAVAAALILKLCRHQSASMRYVIACGALVAMLVSVTLTAALIDAPATDVSPTTTSSVSPAPAGTSDTLLPVHITHTAASADGSYARRVEALLPWIVSAWLCGVLLLLARVTAAWWRVRRLHTVALSTPASSWQATANRIASRLGLARVIQIVELPQIDVPLVVGCLRPVVVLPIAALSSLNAAQVEAIIAHELAHVRRHDYLVNLMQTLAETLLFYHPAVWWLSARIRDEREHCCDDAAVAVCGDPVGYAAALAELEAWRGGALNLAAEATGGSLLARVRRILRVELSEDSRTSSWTVGLIIATTVGGFAANAIAQTMAPAEPKPKFEVASVRENTSGSNQVTFSSNQPGGRFNVVNIPLIILMRSAYRLQDSQLVGAPNWTETARFDITAKAEGDLPPSSPIGPPPSNMVMLQSLLEERFKLKVHSEVREQPIYALVVAQSPGRLGPHLAQSNVDCQAAAAVGPKNPPASPAPPKPGERPQCGTHMGFGEIRGGARPMTLLASMLAQVVQRPVVDRTGLAGGYDFDLRWTPDTLPARPPGTPADQPFRMNGVDIDPTGPSIFTAIQEQLGLKLESTRGPVDVLVVDHIERPTPD
jgi:uncharacterized protein (TIGR03435 family)